MFDCLIMFDSIWLDIPLVDESDTGASDAVEPVAAMAADMQVDDVSTEEEDESEDEDPDTDEE